MYTDGVILLWKCEWGTDMGGAAAPIYELYSSRGCILAEEIQNSNGGTNTWSGLEINEIFYNENYENSVFFQNMYMFGNTI